MTEIVPPWLSGPVDASEPLPAAVKGRKGFLPGRSGCPSGRPVGIKNRRTVTMEKLVANEEAIAEVVVAKALEGDMTACHMVFSRICPPMRAQAPTVQFEFDPQLTLTDQAGALLMAVSRGQIDPETGKGLMAVLSAFAGMKEIDELASQLAELKSHLSIGRRA